MSVDKTIEELSGTLSQLSILVEHINGQIVGITSRINQTLDNFDHSVAGIATDASALTGQVGDTVSQIPNSWVFYLLFITLIVVLILLAILIVINLATKMHAIYQICFPDRSESGAQTPVPSNYSDSRLLPQYQQYDSSLQRGPKSRNHVSIDMQPEGRRPTYDAGVNPSFQDGYPTNRSTTIDSSFASTTPYIRRNPPAPPGHGSHDSTTPRYGQQPFLVSRNEQV